MMMPNKQRLHDDKPDSHLGKSSDDGTGGDLYVLGESAQRDDPDTDNNDNRKNMERIINNYDMDIFESIGTTILSTKSTLGKEYLSKDVSNDNNTNGKAFIESFGKISTNFDDIQIDRNRTSSNKHKQTQDIV